MLFLLLIGQALALPSPLIGPDGPLWFGPLPPGSEASVGNSPRSTVVVHPISGRLQVESVDAPGLVRLWDGRRWTVNGGSIDENWPPRDQLSYEMIDGELVAATGISGVRER